MTDRRAEILPLIAQGKSYREVGLLLDLGRDVVAGIVRRSKELPKPPGQPKPPRPRRVMIKGPKDAERAAQIMRLVDAGKSYRQTALAVGVSRNTVAGVVSRHSIKRPAPVVPPADPVSVAMLAEPGIPPYRWAAVMAIGAQQCRWPAGDPRKRNFHFCGQPTSLGVPYCDKHMAVAYQPASRQRPPSDYVEPVNGRHYRELRFGATK